jgi:hypothetical protein
MAGEKSFETAMDLSNLSQMAKSQSMYQSFAIIRALVVLCNKCIVEFEKNLLLSLISSQIWVVAMFS